MVPLPSLLVFATAEGTPVRFSNFMRRHYKPLVKAAGLPDETTFHALRHSCATLLIGSGVDTKSVQSVLGHTLAATTLDIYADAIEENVDDAMARLREALQRGRTTPTRR